MIGLLGIQVEDVTLRVLIVDVDLAEALDHTLLSSNKALDQFLEWPAKSFFWLFSLFALFDLSIAL